MNQKLIEKYYKDIFRWSLAKTKNRFDAEDLTQEIIYQAMKSFNKIGNVNNVERYIWKIAHYTWCSKVKEYNKLRVVDKNEFILDQAKDEATDIIRDIELGESREEINNIVNNLGGIMKEIVGLYYFKELSVIQISEKLKIKESLVKYYLYEARKKIKIKMEEFL